MSDSLTNPAPNPDLPATSVLGQLNTDELFARGMQSVRITGGGNVNNWEPPTVEEAARLFPNYEVVDVLGRGGMGAVYKAVQTSLERVVAIKLLPLEVSIDRDFADRFVREARTMAKLNHPNIVSVFDFGTTTEGHLFFVMEFVEGTTLHHLIKTTSLKPSQALELIINVCEALHYAHGEGVVHRDIKPANVLVDVKGRIKVADFGLARVDAPTADKWGQTMTGMVLGTPDYMAPEQKNGTRVDHRADIYSLGVMLYEMLCGQVPQGVFAPPSQRAAVDERIDQVVLRAMQQEPDRRYADTHEMKSAVEVIHHTPAPANPMAAVPTMPMRAGPVPASVAAVPASSPATAAPAHKTSSSSWLAGVAAVCALVAVSVVLIQGRRSADPTPPPVVPPPAPELATTAPTVPPSVETKPLVDPLPPIASVSNPPPTEPVAPVATLPSEPPVAITVPPPMLRPPQVLPPPAPGTEPPLMAPSTAQPPATSQPPVPTAEPAVPADEDWRALVADADALMQRRSRDDAMDAYLAAFDLASDGRPIAASDLTQLCRKIANYQVSLGSPAEARQTLEKGRQALKKINSAEKQKFIEQIEKTLQGLPRD